MEIVEHTQHAVVYPNGYLNGSTGEKIDSACSDLMRKGMNRIIINFDRVETINTMGIANLVSVLEKIGRRNGVICFSNLGASNRQIFDVLDISRAVLIFEDETAARKHLADRYGLSVEAIEEQMKEQSEAEASVAVEEEAKAETNLEAAVDAAVEANAKVEAKAEVDVEADLKIEVVAKVEVEAAENIDGTANAKPNIMPDTEMNLQANLATNQMENLQEDQNFEARKQQLLNAQAQSSTEAAE